MCGLAGFVDFASCVDDPSSALGAMARCLVHRGPDDEGIFYDAPTRTGLAFRRLSIIDLTPTGHQPMRSASGRFEIAFNGEVYNHALLRTELTPRGHQFRGNGDTETMLAAFEEWGVERALERGVWLVLHLGHLEQHVQEVAGKAEVIVGIDVRPADAVAIRVGGNGRSLGDQAVDLLLPRLRIEDLLAVRVERRHGADGADEHAHGVGVVGKALHELLDVLVHHRVHGDLVGPLGQLALVRQFAVQDQVGRFEIGAALGQLLDGVSPVHQDALVAVDERNLALARRGVHERRVVGAQPRVVAAGRDFFQVSGADGAFRDRDLVGLPGPVVSDR